MEKYELMEQSILKNLQELSETCVSDFNVSNYYELVDLLYDLWNVRAILTKKNKELYKEIVAELEKESD